MHELAITKSITDVVLRHAEEQHAQKVLNVNMQIGRMRNLKEEWVQYYFARCAKDTIAEDAQINIEYVPIAFYCKECGETFGLDMHCDEDIHCPTCGSTHFDMVCGMELSIVSIEIV